MRTIFTIIFLLLFAMVNATNDSVPIAERINEYDRNYRIFATLEKPSLKTMQIQFAITDVRIGFRYGNESKAVVPQLGDREIRAILM